MKKMLALLLVLVTLLTAASAAFTDQKEIDSVYAAAVDAMVQAGVIGGFPDGTFQPKGTLTRAQAAKIICTMLGKENESAPAAGFVDVPAGHWAEKFVNYCAQQKIVAGVGNGKFDPNGQLKGSQWAKMLLVAYGHDAAELTGDKWFTNTQKAIQEKDLGKDAHLSDVPTTREKACQLAYNFHTRYAFIGGLPQNYAEASLDMVKDTSLYKSYGRMYPTDKGLSVDWPGSGVEFEVECAGDVSITYTAQERGYFQCYVDGQKALRARTATGTRTTVVAEDLAPGKHNIRIIRDHDTSPTAQKFVLTAVSFIGDKTTAKAPADKKLLIEFVGDSITSGKGALVEYLEKDQIYGEGCHSGTSSYAYLTAQKLDADWTMLSRGSMGYFSTSATSCPLTIEKLYPYYNGFAKEPVAYQPTRQADVAVLALCTNDSESKMEKAIANGDVTAYKTYEEAVKWLIAQTRKNNGNDVKIVLIYGMMTSNNSWEPIFKGIADADPNVFALRTTRNNDGGRGSATATGHPSAAGHIVVAEELAKFLQETVLK